MEMSFRRLAVAVELLIAFTFFGVTYQQSQNDPIGSLFNNDVNISLSAPAGPAAGASPVTANSSFTTTNNRPFDYLSGISYQQLDIVKTQWAKILQAAAAASDTVPSEGARIFGKEAFYILSLWYPQSALTIGLPPSRNASDKGGVVAVNSYWDSTEADLQASRFGRNLDRLIFHLVGLDPVGYAKKEDDVAYETYLRNLAFGESKQDIIKNYLHYSTVLGATAGYFLGDAYSPEIKSAFSSVFRFISWRLTTVADLYAVGYYKRYTPYPLTNSPSVLSYLPAEATYPLQSKSFYNCSDITKCRTEIVDADGTPVVRHPLPRSLEAELARDRSTAQVRQSVSSCSGLPREPRAASGAPSLAIPPFSATVDKAVDPFTGISYDQLQLARQTWNNAKAAAANATGLPAALGAVPFELQVLSTVTIWHPESLESIGPISVTGIKPSDINQPEAPEAPEDPYGYSYVYKKPNPFFSNPQQLRASTNVAPLLDQQVTGLTTFDLGLFQRSMTTFNYLKYSAGTRTRGVSYDTISFHSWFADSRLAATEFFLGDQLSDEAYSAWESLLSFIALTTYEVRHMETVGFLGRPFASDFEMLTYVPIVGQ